MQEENIPYESKEVEVYLKYQLILSWKGANVILSFIKNEKKTGNEPIINTGLDNINLLDFWSWAYSDLLGNTQRGKLAEFIVAIAIGTHAEPTEFWGKYDLLSHEGISIEVKSSAYIQSWQQKQESKIIFSIKPTFGWNSKTNEYDQEKRRQADVYVFCVLKHRDEDSINPLDVNQWDFYVLSTSILNQLKPSQSTISLNGLINLGAVPCSFLKLKEIIHDQKYKSF